jgi:GWxTD domain-containing protein
MQPGFAVLLIAVASTSAVQAQPGEPLPARPWDSREFLSATALWSPESLKQRIDVFLRINKSVFVSFRNTDRDAPAPFRRMGELTIELLDSNNGVQGRHIERIEVPEEQAESPPVKLDWLESQYAFAVPPGAYQVRAEIFDLQSKNRIVKTQSIHTVEIRPRDSLTASAAFLYVGSDRRMPPDTIRPQNFGVGTLFSSPGGLLIEVVGADPGTGEATISYRLTVEERDRPLLWRPDTVITVPLRHHLRMETIKPVGYALVFDSSATTRAVALLPLPLEQLPLRRFRLDITIQAGKRRSTLSVPFAILWPDQPESLRDVDYALESLRFLVPEQVLDSLTRGSFETRRDNLERFWKSHDTTPETADNPLMTEYYRRVDLARMQFVTLKQRDGTRTDRGKIFVLYGPPTSSDRSLDPASGFTETWVYSRLKKKFIFKDEARNGSYVLSSTTSL